MNASDTPNIDRVQEAIGWIEIALGRRDGIQGDARIDLRNAVGYLRDHKEAQAAAERAADRHAIDAYYSRCREQERAARRDLAAAIEAQAPAAEIARLRERAIQAGNTGD